MFINLSNHPSEQWSKEQITAAMKFGQIRDIPFPSIDPEWDNKAVLELAGDYFEKATAMADPDLTVMVQGEFVFTFSLVRMLKEQGYKAVAACTKRVVVETRQEDVSVKTTKFQFVQFREY